MIAWLIDIGELITGALFVVFVAAVVLGLVMIGVFEAFCWMRRGK